MNGTFFPGSGGSRGFGANAYGGGAFVESGSLTLTGSNGDNPLLGASIENDLAKGGFFGNTGDSRIDRYFGAEKGVGGDAGKSPTAIIGGSPSGRFRMAARSRKSTAHLDGKGHDVRGVHGKVESRGLAASTAASSTPSSGFRSSSSSANLVGVADGGGIYVESGSVSISGGVVIANDLANYAGALWNSSQGKVTISGGSIAGNNANIGGAMVNFGALSIVNADIAGNVATPPAHSVSGSSFHINGGRGTSGGAIFNKGVLSVVGGVMANNTAGFGGDVDKIKGSAKFSGVSNYNNIAH